MPQTITVKEKIVRTTIKRIENRLVKLKAISDARPLCDLIQLRKETNEKLKDTTLITRQTLEILGPAAREEKRLLALSDKQFDIKLIDEEVRITAELHDLQNKLFYIQMQSKRR